ncbi:uncharacterized protein TM35_000012240 [Trypanosoma theileri]|uniref:Arrestin-like N-terminal domain-containing protein n=1 Tax=Trypanosoma theileri TaxID=67003 RepID=A0A1X0P8T4_9TRYP|nr:uncharacterized protein TM35_000012240 [Trypanosoma theileri]ORC93347.1 hypothetical protein TM35_000012240 [Trypanosoma theileri]
MATVSRGNVELSITFESETAEYIPGGILSGVIKITLNKEFSLRAIRLRIRAEEYARIGLGPSPTDNTRIHYDKIYTFARELRKSESPETASLLLTETGSEGEDFMNPDEVLSPGVYEYPFGLDLPEFLPPSFEIRCKLDTAEARLMYTARAYLDIRTGFDLECFKPFYILSAISRLLYTEKMDERTEKKVTFNVPLKNSSRCGFFGLFNGGHVRVTKLRVEPKVILMDASKMVNRSFTSVIDNNNNPSAFVHVNIVNNSRKTLDIIRVRLMNVAQIRLNNLHSFRCVDIGEPFIYKGVIQRGDEKSFVAKFCPNIFLPYSTVNNSEKDDNDVHSSFSSYPLIPRRKQKGYVLYEQPLMDVTTAFVSSHCVVSVEFPGYKFEEIFMPADVLLAGTIDEGTSSMGFPCVYDNKSFSKRSLLNNVYILQPNIHDYTESPERAQYVSPILNEVEDPTGIFPAYTAGIQRH